MSSVKGVADPAGVGSLSLRDVLSLEGDSELLSSVHFSYVLSLAWLLDQFPAARRAAKLLCVLGREEAAAARVEATELGVEWRVAVAAAPLPIPFGTHHTKGHILRFPTGIRIVIHTANLYAPDWLYKTQGTTPFSPQSFCPPKSCA